MTIDEVQNYFGSLYQVCKQLNIKQQNITGWRRKGYIPLLQQYRIAELTEGNLLPDEIDPKITHKK
jgi:hypothetical protein